MKKIIIILLLAVSIFSTACSQNENKDTPNKNESSQEEKELIFTEEKSDIVDGSHMYELFDKLASYGREIYKNEEYIKYSKKDGAYFISLKELSKKYDVSMFKGEDGTVCDQQNSGIYFDTEHVIDENSGKEPIIPILISCEKNQQ